MNLSLGGKTVILIIVFGWSDVFGAILRFEGSTENIFSRLEGFTTVGPPPGSTSSGRGITSLVVDIDTENERISFPEMRMDLTGFTESATRQFSGGLGQPAQDFTISFSFNRTSFIFKESTREWFELSQTAPGRTEFDILGMPRSGKPFSMVGELRLSGSYSVIGPSERADGVFDVLIPDDPRFFYEVVQTGLSGLPGVETNDFPDRIRLINDQFNTSYNFLIAFSDDYPILSETVDGVLVEQSLTDLRGLREDAFILDFKAQVPEPSSAVLFLWGGFGTIICRRRY